MTEKKWTPGPWWSHCDDERFDFRVRQWTDPASRGPYENGELICSTSPDISGSYDYQHRIWERASNPPFCPAYFNAKLIAAAPDLYEALEYVYKNGDGEHGRQMMKTALAKARGEA